MGYFTSLLHAYDLPADHLRQVTRALSYLSNAGRKFTVPIGFISDGASTPRPLWFDLPPWNLFSRAFVLHDYLYASHVTSRSEADSLLFEALVSLGCGWWQAEAIYLGVRAIGWLVWRTAPTSTAERPQP